MSIRSIKDENKVSEALGFVSECIDDGAEKIIVIFIDDKSFAGKCFGGVSSAELALMGSVLQRQAVDNVWGEE